MADVSTTAVSLPSSTAQDILMEVLRYDAERFLAEVRKECAEEGEARRVLWETIAEQIRKKALIQVNSEAQGRP